MKKFWFLKIAVFAIGFVVLGGFVVMSLWNWLIPSIFGLTTITFAQALGLLVLSKILFGGFRGGGGCFGGGRHHYWKQKMADKWSNMTPEQREEFKNTMKNRFGRWKTE